MDKAGVEELERFAVLDRYAGLSFSIFFLLWFVAVNLALLIRQRKNFPCTKTYWRSLIPDVLLPPSVLIMGWLLLLARG